MFLLFIYLFIYLCIYCRSCQHGGRKKPGGKDRRRKLEENLKKTEEKYLEGFSRTTVIN
jgi:hypothetical protein